MTGVFEGFATIGAVIALGALLAHFRVLDTSAQLLLSRLAFFVASPALMVVTLGSADVSMVLSRNLVASLAGVVVAGGTYAVLARVLWRRRLGHTVIGTLSSSYVNAGNLGIPVAAYVLGNAAYVAPTLLMQLLVLQPVALAVLDADARGGRPPLRDVLVRPFTNPLTVGSLLGLALAVTGWTLPAVVQDPVELVANMAVPAMLLAYGVALRLGPGLGSGGSAAEVTATSALKLVARRSSRSCSRATCSASRGTRSWPSWSPRRSPPPRTSSCTPPATTGERCSPATRSSSRRSAQSP